MHGAVYITFSTTMSSKHAIETVQS